MRRVIVQEFVTLHGFAAGRNGEPDFIRESTSVDAVGSGMWLFPEGAEATRMGLLETKTRNGVLSLGLRPL